ncbi:MAG: hypothetical protein KME45_15600 [Stenomitos rutilans HA7619-LM2]|jgi:hypothetical protein|nr:hypothetical protein [Stenomitos rutilans HA7619-LM2]
MKTGQPPTRSLQQIEREQPISKRASFSLLMSTVAIILGMLVVAALYYYNTNTHLTP